MSLTKEERIIMSNIAYDFVTGRHLVTVVSDEEKNMLREFADLFKTMELGDKFTERESCLIKALSDQFYGGMEDMCEQIGIDYKELKHALDEPD